MKAGIKIVTYRQRRRRRRRDIQLNVNGCWRQYFLPITIQIDNQRRDTSLVAVPDREMVIVPVYRRSWQWYCMVLSIERIPSEFGYCRDEIVIVDKKNLLLVRWNWNGISTVVQSLSVWTLLPEVGFLTFYWSSREKITLTLSWLVARLWHVFTLNNFEYTYLNE